MESSKYDTVMVHAKFILKYKYSFEQDQSCALLLFFGLYMYLECKV